VLPAGGGPRPSFTLRNPPMPRPVRAPPLPPTPWRGQLAANPDEHELLAPLRLRPSDEGVRMVYADWLEQRGEVARARFVRLQGDSTDDAGDAAWRAITSRGQVWRCHREPCTQRWDLLEARADDERTRDCATCSLPVKYCVDVDAAMRVGANDRCPITIDASIDGREGRLAFDRGLGIPIPPR
jgi:uncharacterized protein (TIGR02996 family)